MQSIKTATQCITAGKEQSVVYPTYPVGQHCARWWSSRPNRTAPSLQEARLREDRHTIWGGLTVIVSRLELGRWKVAERLEHASIAAIRAATGV